MLRFGRPVIHLKRYISTDSQLFTKYAQETRPIDRTSNYSWYASEFIENIRSGDYDNAALMVKNGTVNVNSHNWGEDTALTDAASRGDTKAINFLLKTLKANPYASCDCPHHKTAFHYAAENGHASALKALLDFVGPNGRVNILDNRRKTPLDLAKDNNIAKLLRARNVMSGSSLKKHERLTLFPK